MKAQHRFKSEKHNVFTEEIDKIALNLNDDKIMQTMDLIETYAYGTSKDLVNGKEKIKCDNLMKNTKWLTLMLLQNKT